jgi:iodothyronine deiodinase-like protein
VRDRANVAFVYIAEAHAVDEWQMQSNIEEGVLLHRHGTLEERFAAAREGVERLGLTMPVLVDGMDDAVSEAFAAWPERLYVAEPGGRLAYVGGPGPFEFDPDAAASVLDGLLG